MRAAFRAAGWGLFFPLLTLAVLPPALGLAPHAVPWGPFLMYLPAVILAAATGGWCGAVTATAAGAALGARSAVGPLIEVRALFFILCGAGTALLAFQIRSARLLAQERERAFQSASSRKDEFIAMLAHELRNPIGAIVNALQIIQLRDGDDEVVQRARGVIERQVRHMRRLLDDLMDASRITRGDIPLNRAVVSIHAAMMNALETVRPKMDRKRHEVNLSLGYDALLTDGDPVRLEQVFTNLLTNAAKYTPDGGRIDVAARREDGDVRITVRDNGCGIAPHLLPCVFDLFTQGDRTGERAEGGLGVGLALVRQIVLLHGGSVVAKSPGVGQGSEFIVRLPVLSPAPAPEPPRPAGRPATPGGAHVLVVEDNVDSGSSLVEVLTLLGYHAMLALDGPRALEMLAEGPLPHVVLLDIGLPVMDGHTLAREIRKTHGYGMLLIALTGYGQEEDRERSREAGCDLHMTKPLDIESLGRVLQGGEP